MNTQRPKEVRPVEGTSQQLQCLVSKDCTGNPWAWATTRTAEPHYGRVGDRCIHVAITPANQDNLVG